MRRYRLLGVSICDLNKKSAQRHMPMDAALLGYFAFPNRTAWILHTRIIASRFSTVNTALWFLYYSQQPRSIKQKQIIPFPG